MNPEAKDKLEESFDPSLLNSLGIDVENIATDSRMVKPGDTFLAYVGEKIDARKFIPQAIEAGANAVLWERNGFVWNSKWGNIPNLPVSKLRAKVGAIASHVYGNPSGELRLIGVTGTNGKTSCVQWIAQALTKFDIKTASIGTLGDGFADELRPAVNTTPEPVLLQQRMASFLKHGAQSVVMEVSSHGIEQGRINGSTLSVALFTNLSHDHLDYHGNMQAYAATKARLFHWAGLKYAVLNFDDVFSVELTKQLTGRATHIIGYGFEELGIERDLKLFKMVHGRNLRVSSQGLEFDVVFEGERIKVKTALIGEFNASNLLAVFSTLLACGLSLSDAAKSLQEIQPIPGRMEKFGGGNLPLVVIDFAHTPEALEKTLIALREVINSAKDISKIKNKKSKLVCIFGCGGDRDQDKRALMGKIATELSDESIITSDNPRNEDPCSIINEIVSGADINYLVQENREAAIRRGLYGAHKGDIVLIAGKGLEVYQEIGVKRFPFSDAKVVRLILKELRSKVQGPQE